MPKKKYENGLPGEIGGAPIASITELDKKSNEVDVTTFDPLLIESIKDQYPDAESDDSGVKISNADARTFQKVIATQQGSLHKRGHKSQSHLQFGEKLFAAIVVLSITWLVIILFK